MHPHIIDSINEVTAENWNSLVGRSNPFLHHEFLSALERHQCVGERYGWIPQHIIVTDTDNQLVGATPLYLKDNSYGEFVFDWAWADAYARSGLEYYPKLVSATPYTPVTGARLLISDVLQYETIAGHIIDAALKHARQQHVSSLHWLFTSERDTRLLEQHDHMLRSGVQFHWQNQGYTTFDDFLATLSSRKRKQIKRERRQVRDASIELRILSGHDISEAQWHTFHRHYESTFLKLGGYATLSLDFFLEIGQTMADNVVLVMAFQQQHPVASAFCLRDDDTLFGRHWGCDADFVGLHFEACYYQGIEYCIRHGLSGFEPGAQGEHKISRGFLPTQTWSAHWIAHPQFRKIIGDFLRHETAGMKQYADELTSLSPYKQTE